MEINGVMLTGTEAKRTREGLIAGVDLNINIENVDIKSNGEVTLNFTYTANYRPDMGYLKMTGNVVGKSDKEEGKKLAEEYKKTKRLPADIGEPILNMINATAGINGIFVARAINLAPPIIPARISLVGEQEQPSFAKGAKK